MMIELEWIEDPLHGGRGLRIGYAPGTGLQLRADEVRALRAFLAAEPGFSTMAE